MPPKSSKSKPKKNNAARDKERRMAQIRDNVIKSWYKSQNPNMFGGCPVMDPKGRIISVEIASFGYVAEFFEQEDVQERLREAFRLNNLNFNGYAEDDLEDGIKEKVESWAPKPDVPIFLMKSYPLQSYLSQLMRYINKLSNVKGITWGLDNKDAESPGGWRDDLLEFSKYGGPGRSYEGKGKLPPRLKDIIVHYFWLLGLNPNEYCKEVPEDYVPRDLDNLDFLPPPESFEMPAWATPPEYEDEESEDEVVTRKKRLRSPERPSTATRSSSPEPATPLAAYRRPLSPIPKRRRPRGPSASPSPSPPSPARPSRSTTSRPSSPSQESIGSASPPQSTPASRRRSASPYHSPPVRPSMRRSVSQPPSSPPAPQASSTLCSEVDVNGRGRIVLHIKRAGLPSKEPKKKARLSSSRKVCFKCHQVVTLLDIRSRNPLVSCGSHSVHRYCQEDCLEDH